MDTKLKLSPQDETFLKMLKVEPKDRPYDFEKAASLAVEAEMDRLRRQLYRTQNALEFAEARCEELKLRNPSGEPFKNYQRRINNAVGRYQMHAAQLGAIVGAVAVLGCYLFAGGGK